MSLNEFLRERERFFCRTQRYPTKVTLHPADAADLLLALKPWEICCDPQGLHTIAGATLYESACQDVGRAKFEIAEEDPA